MPNDENVNEQWRQILTKGEPMPREMRRLFRLLPSSPRCKICNAPFKGFGGRLMALIGRDQSRYNPRFCTVCQNFDRPGGAEVELSMLFADVRGSTELAEQMSPLEFSDLINRFYIVGTDVLVRFDAMVDRLIGDEVVGLFIPGMAGPEHANKAISAAHDLLERTGHHQSDGPWLPVGIGVHTGPAFVGVVGGDQAQPKDFTALGDSVNVAARLAAQAQPGEVLISEAAYAAGKSQLGPLERRQLKLKGKQGLAQVRVLRVGPS